MAELIKKVKVMQTDGTFTDYIPLGADAANVKTEDGMSVENKLKKKPYYFDTVADMKAAAYLKAGDMAITKGYYSSGDGGHAEYVIQANSNKYYEELNNNLLAELLFENQIHSKQIGLKGDGVTDETVLLNTFYELDLFANKVLDAGIYLISDTIYIKGLWRQDREQYHNNGNIHFKFENATFKYNGTASGCSICFYNMFKIQVSGLSIDRTSIDNYVQVIGCWNCVFENFDINDLGLLKDDTILTNKVYTVKSLIHNKFKNGLIYGTITIDHKDSYTNGTYFEHVSVASRNKDYCCILNGTENKHNVVFNECDLSYATNSVFYVPERQEGVIEDSVGRCNIMCFMCYFDSAIPLFYNNTQNNVTFSDYGSMFSSGNIKQIENIKLYDYLKNSTLSSNVFTGNTLPTILVNLCNNGNFKNGTQININNNICGITRTGIVKEIITSNSNVYGYAQKLTVTTDISQRITSIPVPYDGTYTVAIRLKKISGSGDIQLSLGNQHNIFKNEDIPVNEEIILVNNKPIHTYSIGDEIVGAVQFSNVNNLVLEVYECMIIPGRMVICGLPLHSACEIPTN